MGENPKIFRLEYLGFMLGNMIPESIKAGEGARCVPRCETNMQRSKIIYRHHIINYHMYNSDVTDYKTNLWRSKIIYKHRIINYHMYSSAVTDTRPTSCQLFDKV